MLHVSCLKGFSLMEALLATFLLSVGIVAVLSLMASSLRSSMVARDQEIATLLAQEGVELVRNVRDNNWADGNDSFNNLPSGIKTLSRDGGGFYVEGSGSPTKFKRNIVIENVANETRIVTSTVVWDGTFESGSACNMTSRCAFAKIVLSRWGE